MVDDFDNIPDIDPENLQEIGGDSFVDAAREEILKLFASQPEGVFYERQLQVLLEKRFFHWITARAANQLVEERKIRSEWLPLIVYGERTRARFFFSTQRRYWTRTAKEIGRLISAYSNPAVTAATGSQAEMLFDAALARAGFTIEAIGTREYQGRKWEETNHNLDRIYVRDGFAYGAEIKNKLGYMEGEELFRKLRISRHLGITPLFIARMLPKSWIYEVWKQGGFSLIYEAQVYPFGMELFVEELKEKLGLPVACPKSIPSGIVQRLLNFHKRRLSV